MFHRVAFFLFWAVIISPSAHSQTLQIRMATTSPAGTPVWRGAEAYRNAINGRLDGLARIDLVPEMTPNALEQVRTGKVEMAIVASAALASSKAQSLALLDLPFFFRDLREVSAIQQSLVGEMMLGAVNEDRALIGLAYWNTGILA